MPPAVTSGNTGEMDLLLRGKLESLAAWTEQWSARRFWLHVGVILLGAGLYGAAMGCWRDPQQALYVAIKFPLIILLTVIGNALLNGMLAPLLGLNIPFRQSFSAILMSFAVTAAILGAFSPLLAFVVWNAPPISQASLQGVTYNFIKLANVAAIAFAGTTGNARLFQLLVQTGGSRAVAFRVLFAWLTINLFLGSQLSWILRPFIGSPNLPVEFFRATALHGNFYENIFQTVLQIFND
ncbi:MAG TPA: hypothetical protein VKS19_07690 [Verrucomicrobiae bacterium]|nr:hypothetical protein [Verrucomicrobiae bacterium]